VKRVLSLGALALALAPAVGVGQRPTVVAGSFTPAGQILYFTDFSQDAVGSFPRGLRHVKGPLEVVDVGGTRMLRSTGPSEFLIPLSGRLPQDFTLEFEFIPRGSRMYGGEELSFEGGPVQDESAGSAHVLWNQMLTRIRGGGSDGGQVLLSEDLKGELLGQQVSIQVMVTGSSFKLFTNGRQLHNVPNLAFRRAAVLRVYLGGVNDGNEAVYLARIRLATGGPMPVAGTPTVAPGPTTVGTNRPPTSGTTAATTPPPAGTIPGTITTVPPSTPAPGTVVSNPAQPTTTGPPPLARSSPPPSAQTPVATRGSVLKSAARCVPGATTGPAPWWFGAGVRVGGAALDWFTDPNTEYLLERADVANPSVWTTVASTCGAPLNSYNVLWEDGKVYTSLRAYDNDPAVQLGGRYQYRLTAIQADQSAGSAMVSWEAQSGSFQSAPSATVSGRDVAITTPVSYCSPLGVQCNPSSVEFTVTTSSTGFSYTSRQAWVDNADPLAQPGTFTFTIPGVSPGVHTFTVTALYPPAFRVVAGTVTVTVP
jgi:hypothetical protein